MSKDKWFEISLSQWSFHKDIFGNSREDYNWFIKTLYSEPEKVLLGKMNPRDIVSQASEMGINYVDLVNVFFFGRADDRQWLTDFRQQAAASNVKFVCLMVDQAGDIGSSDPDLRKESVEKHKIWMDAAVDLGCSQFRVNAYGNGSYLQQLQHCSESLFVLAYEADKRGIELLVENHGHPGGIGAWLNMLVEQTNHPNLGIFTDLDNFFMGGWNHNPQRRYDRTQGIIDLAPYTRGISAKSYAFDEDGLEKHIDYPKCLKIIKDSGFSGFASAEYEGDQLSDLDGTRATIELLKRFQHIDWQG